MAKEFQSITKKVVAKGFDKSSAKSSVEEGYAEDIINMDTTPAGALETRKGYEGYYGHLPCRAVAAYTDHYRNKVGFIFDKKLQTPRPGPVTVIGKGSGVGGVSYEFSPTTTTTRKYTEFTTTERLTLDHLAPGVINTPQYLHGVSTTYVFGGISLSSSEENYSNSLTLFDNQTTLGSTKQVNLSYTNNIPGQRAFHYYRGTEPNVYTNLVAAGVDRGLPFNSSGDTITTGTPHGLTVGDLIKINGAMSGVDVTQLLYVVYATSTTFKVSYTEGGSPLALATATGFGNSYKKYSWTMSPGFSTTNIIANVFDLAGGNHDKLAYAAFSVYADGYSCRVSFGSLVPSNDFVIILEEAPEDNFVTKPFVGALGSQSFSFPCSDAVVFPQIQEFNENENRYDQILVDSWDYDDVAKAVTVTFTTNTTGYVNICWIKGNSVSNAIEVTALSNLLGSSVYTTDVQLTVWGVSLEEGVLGLDSYRTAEVSQLISSMSGIVCKASPFSDIATSHGLAVFAQDVSLTLKSSPKLAPLFYTANPGSVRDRGVIYDSSVVDNKALVSAATYVSPGVVSYTLSFVSKSATLGSQVDSFDWLTVSGLAHSEHNGTFQIISVADAGPTSASITVSNPAVNSSRLNETGAFGYAGVFTDKILFAAQGAFVAGDLFLSEVLEDTRVKSMNWDIVDNTQIYIDNVKSSVVFPVGMPVYAGRTSSLVKVSSAARGIVAGDMLEVSSLSHKVRVLSAHFYTTDPVMTFLDGVFTCSVPHNLVAGDKILLGLDVIGEKTVSAVLSPTTFTTEETYSSNSFTSVLWNNTVQLDEEIYVDNNTRFNVEGRWVPVEAPVSTQTQPLSRYRKYFTDEQSPVKSTSLKDKLFFTNGTDEVMTFDGETFSRAGLPLWQPFLFVSQHGSGTTLTSGVSSVTGCDYSEGVVSKTGTNAPQLAGFHIGDSISITIGSDVAYATVHNITITEAAAGSKVTLTLSGMTRKDTPFNGTSSLAIVSSTPIFRYYFRLQYRDSKGNVISSAMSGFDDCVVRYVGLGPIEIKLLGIPALGNYQYNNVTVEVYRSQADLQQMYFITSKQVMFGATDGYILFVDSVSDLLLKYRNDVDPFAGVKGAELATGWGQPPRAKHISTANGVLALANLKGYPELTLNFEGPVGSTDLAASALHGKMITLRKDSSSSSTTTDVSNVAVYEFKNSGAVSGTASSSSGTVTIYTGASTAPTVNSWVYVFNSAQGTSKYLGGSGWYKVTARNISNPSSQTFSYKDDSITTNLSSHPLSFVQATVPTNIPVWLGTDGNYNNLMTQSSSDVKFTAAVFLANAINASMRTVSDPWVIAYAGASYAAGQVVLNATKVLGTTPELVAPASFSGYTLYIDDVQATADEQVSFSEKKFPSRVVLSYANHPEIFDNPTADVGGPSDSVVDINPADGQEITALAPFFGASAGSETAQFGQKMVVFKTNSIYLLNIKTREVEKLDSRGLGCTAPASVASGKNCLFFANESGICRLNRDLTVNLEAKLTNFWRREVNRDALAVAAGHHYSVGRRYKLSLPLGQDTFNSQVAVYDYEPEDRGEPGGWVRYTNFNATGWCNLASKAFWSSADGNVFQVRDRGEPSDYRDDGGAVAESSVTLRAEDFGLPGVRKVVQNVVTFVDLVETDLTNLKVYSALDLSNSFTLQAQVSKEIGEARHFRTSFSSRRGNYFQIQYKHQQKDQRFTLASLAYTVGQLSYKLTREASNG